MQDHSPKPRHKLYGGIGVSVALHAIIAAIVLVQLPPTDITPSEEEETVSVEMVPPPEEPQPETAEQALNVPKMAPPPEQQPPPPPAEPQPLQEQAVVEQAPPPPEETAQEETQQPQAEQPQTEQETAEMPPAESSAQDQMGGEAAAEQEAGRGQPLPVLRPVFEYGDEASGDGVTRNGNASDAEQADETETVEPDTAETSPDASEPGEAATADAGAANGEPESEAAAPDLPDDIETPSVDMAETVPLPSNEDAPGQGTRTELSADPQSDPSEEKPEPSESNANDAAAGPAQEDRAQDEPPRPARRLFSEQNTGDQVARTAVGDVPREIRAGQLCSTELTEQLRHGSRRFNPDIVPAFKLPEGTVLDVRQAAFRADSRWYDIRFRCEVNENATRVVSFGLDIGDPVPRSEWRARRFPEF